MPLLAIRVVPQITAVCDPVFLDIRAVRLGLAAVEHVFEKTPPARRKVEPVPPSLERFCRPSIGNLPRVEMPAISRALDIGRAEAVASREPFPISG